MGESAVNITPRNSYLTQYNNHEVPKANKARSLGRVAAEA